MTKTATTLAILAILAAQPSRADVVMDFGQGGIFSGPADAQPGAFQAVFKTITPGSVRLTLRSALADGAFLLPNGAAYFNVDPAIDPTSLLFVMQSGGTGLTWQAGADAFKPDGDGLMDLKLTGAPADKVLPSGQSAVWTIQGTGLVEASFLYASICRVGCGTGSHLAAVHVGGLPDGGGGTTSVWAGPTDMVEPGAAALMGSGLIGLALLSRRRRGAR